MKHKNLPFQDLTPIAFETVVKKAVVANKTYDKAVACSAGLSVWFPLLKTDYVTRRSEYVALRYSKDYPNWTKFLDVLFAGRRESREKWGYRSNLRSKKRAR